MDKTNQFQAVTGGAGAAKGFRVSGVHCGIRKNKVKKDLALLVSEVPCTAAAVYTLNTVKGAPLLVTKENLADGRLQAMICNSGNANTCNPNGVETARQMCALVSKATGIRTTDVAVASTGVIGQPLDVTPIENGMPALVENLKADGTDAAEAIMTTDTFAKQHAVRFSLGGKVCTVGGMAKGSGMIHPNMATLLVFITTDAAIESNLLQKAVSADVERTFNMVSVDGDTSTNDMLLVLANGKSGAPEILPDSAEYATFVAALNCVTQTLCRMIAKDGEGATKLLECKVSGAKDEANARIAAKSVISSTLFKCAMFGADANWGRALCAIGYSGAEVDLSGASLRFCSRGGEVEVCRAGGSIPFSEELAKKVLNEDEIVIDITLNEGGASATAWGCDMTYDYVKINGDYRS